MAIGTTIKFSSSTRDKHQERNKGPTTMLKLTALLLLTIATVAHADVKERLVIDLPETAGTIRKMQIDLTQDKTQWIADTKSLNNKGKKLEARLSCRKVTGDEYECSRDDNGGGFNLLLGATPKVTFTYFTANEEGSE